MDACGRPDGQTKMDLKGCGTRVPLFDYPKVDLNPRGWLSFFQRDTRRGTVKPPTMMLLAACSKHKR